MAKEVHFEIFSRQGTSGGWRMLDVRAERDAAIDYAKSLMADEKATGVKVVKETLNDETGEYLTLKIFEDGHNQFKSKPEAEDIPHALPCFKPDDLYSYHARATITRLLGDYLARNRLTLIELGHRADALEKLEATGTLLQHAIQKVAVAQASSTTMQVQQIVKSLNELVNKAFQRVYRDQRKNYFPPTEPNQFSALAAKLQSDADGLYVLNGAIAQHLRNAASWDEKVTRLIDLMEQAEGEGRALLLSSIDAIIAEIVSGRAALRELIGAQETFGHEVESLVELFLGTEPNAEAGCNGLMVLARHFAADDLPDARTALAQRVMVEFRSMKRFCPDSLFEEFKIMRKIADRLVRGVGKYLSHEDLVDAVVLRSRRVVTHETLTEHLADAATPEEKVDRLLSAEENIVGNENKRKLATFVLSVVGALNFETHFQDSKQPPLARMQILANLQTRVLQSGLQDNQRGEIADILDRIASDVEARARLLETIAANAHTPVERANKLLKLCTGNFLTEGQLSGRARALVLTQLSKPGFLSSYTAQIAREGEVVDTETGMIELVAVLGKAGISAEAGLKSIAA